MALPDRVLAPSAITVPPEQHRSGLRRLCGTFSCVTHLGKRCAGIRDLRNGRFHIEGTQSFFDSKEKREAHHRMSGQITKNFAQGKLSKKPIQSKIRAAILPTIFQRNRKKFLQPEGDFTFTTLPPSPSPFLLKMSTQCYGVEN